MDELKRNIKFGAMAPVYFLYGNESYLIDHYTNQIAKSVVTALPEINLRTFEITFDIDEIISVAYQVPMLSLKKCLIINDINLSDIKQSQLDKLLQLVTSPSDVSVVIFKYTSIELILDKNAKGMQNFKALATAIDKSGGIVAKIEHLSPADTVRTIVSGAKRRGCEISNETARFMIEYCSLNLSSLLQELEKLCAYVGEGEITVENIKNLCIRSINAIIYDMAKAILSKDAKKSMSILDSLLAQKYKESDILNEISGAYINIYRMHSAQSSNVTQSTVAEDFNYGARQFLLNSASGFAKRLTADQIESSLDAIFEADAMLKGASKMKNSDVLRVLISKLVLISTKGEIAC